MDFDMNILIADDFTTMRRIVKRALTQLGFNNFLEVEDGNKALEALEKEKVGLIISDWNMPNMTGIELLKAVRGNDKLKDIPFVMVTAEGQKERVMEAVEAGVTNYVVKPFTPETLQEKLKKIFKT